MVQWARLTWREAPEGSVGEWEHDSLAGALAGVWGLVVAMLRDGGRQRASVTGPADELVLATGDVRRLAVSVEVIGWHWMAVLAPRASELSNEAGV